MYQKLVSYGNTMINRCLCPHDSIPYSHEQSQTTKEMTLQTANELYTVLKNRKTNPKRIEGSK